MAITATQLRNFANLPPVGVVADETLDMYIAIADSIMGEDFAGVALTPARDDAIRLNLAAHFAIVAQERGGLTQQIVGQSEERYTGVSNKNSGLGLTQFGQQALALDPTGVLDKYSAKPLKAEIEVI